MGYLCEFIEAVREAIGWEVPLGADHFGRLSVNDSIRYARAFEPYQYDHFIVDGFRRAGPWPHYDAEGKWVDSMEE